MLFVYFIALAAVICFAGVRLTNTVDKLSEETGIGRGFLGVFLLALITSSPELFATTTASVIGNTGLSLGNILGSNVFNLTMLVWADLFLFGAALSRNVSVKSLANGLGSLLMLGLLGIAMSLAGMGIYLHLLGVPLMDWVLLAVYILLLRNIWREEQNRPSDMAQAEDGVGRLWREVAVYSAMIIVSGILISIVCDKISHIQIKGVELGGTLVGSVLLGMATSLPEMSVTISAVRLGAVDMAIANVFGSNMFNEIIVFFADLFGKRSILSADYLQIFSLCTIGAMSAVFLLFSINKSQKRFLSVGLSSIIIGFMYIIWLSVLYFARH